MSHYTKNGRSYDLRVSAVQSGRRKHGGYKRKDSDKEGNTKQLILSTSWPVQDQVLVDLAVDGSGEVLNVALAALAEISGVKIVSVVHIIGRS
jgi:hypothetical protein